MSEVYISASEVFLKKISQFSKYDQAMILSNMTLIAEDRYDLSRFSISVVNERKDALQLELDNEYYQIVYSKVSDIEMILWDIVLVN